MSEISNFKFRHLLDELFYMTKKIFSYFKYVRYIQGRVEEKR